MVVAKKKEDISRIKVLALHGMNKDAWHRFGDEGYKHYQVTEAGFKYNMMDIQAAIGIHQLERVDENHKRRVKIWNSYQEAFNDLPVIRPSEPEQNTLHARHLYTLLIDQKNANLSRDQFLVEMTKRNIGIGVHYQSIASHPYYQTTYNFKPESYPVSEKIGKQTVSLPLSAALSENEIDRIIDSVKQTFES